MPKLKYQSSGAGPMGRRCGWPKRYCERSLKARYTSTAFGHRPTPTAATACCTVVHAPTAPPGVRDHQLISSTPRLRMSSSSSLPSTVKVTRPSTSVGREPGVEDRARGTLRPRAASCCVRSPSRTRWRRFLRRCCPSRRGPFGDDSEERRDGSPVVSELDDHREIVVRTVVRWVNEVRHEPCPFIELHEDHDARFVVGTVRVHRREPRHDPPAAASVGGVPGQRAAGCHTSVSEDGAACCSRAHPG